MIQFAKPDITSAEILKVESTLKSGWLTGGPKVAAFAMEVANQSGTDHAVCYDSCTAAMEMSLRALGIGPGDEVITTPTPTQPPLRSFGTWAQRLCSAI